MKGGELEAIVAFWWWTRVELLQNCVTSKCPAPAKASCSLLSFFLLAAYLQPTTSNFERILFLDDQAPIHIMANEASPEKTIRSLFDSAEQTRSGLDSFFSTSEDAYQVKLNSAITDLEECKDLITRSSLFSTNEGLEDVATADLR